MAVASRKRWRVVPLGLALAVAGAVGGATGLVAWRRARVPWRTLHLGPKAGVRFFVGDRALVTGRAAVSTSTPRRVDVFEEVWSLGDGRLLHTNDGYAFLSWDPASGSRLRLGPGGSLELEDPVTESCRHLLDSGVASDRVSMAVSPTRDLVAFVSTAGVEVRSTVGAPARPSLVLPSHGCARLAFSPGGDSLASDELGEDPRDPQQRVLVWALGSPGSPRVFEGSFLGFNSRGEVVTVWSLPSIAAGEGVGKVTVHRASGESPVVAEVKSEYAVSLWCERLAALEPDRRSVVVSELESGELVRRVRVGPNVQDVYLSPEGDKLAVVFEDGLVEVWELPPS